MIIDGNNITSLLLKKILDFLGTMQTFLQESSTDFHYKNIAYELTRFMQILFQNCLYSQGISETGTSWSFEKTERIELRLSILIILLKYTNTESNKCKYSYYIVMVVFTLITMMQLL